MTRDEVCITLKQAIEYGRSTVPVRLAYDQLAAHDADQRQAIEELRQELELLKSDDAERCILIRDMDEEERRKDAELEQQAQQIATLREALEGMLFIFGHHEGYAQVEAAQQALKEVKE